MTTFRDDVNQLVENGAQRMHETSAHGGAALAGHIDGLRDAYVAAFAARAALDAFDLDGTRTLLDADSRDELLLAAKVLGAVRAGLGSVAGSSANGGAEDARKAALRRVEALTV